MATKRYITIGINKYQNAPLNGCVNDANDWAQHLDDLGYIEGITIHDGSATKATILEMMREQIGKMKYRDTLVIQYSGHGSWIPDRDGDEPDGRDEVWCAYDYENGGLISDDEIHNVISQRAYGTRVIMISDSCHSGTVHRFAGAPIRRADNFQGGTEKPRYMPPALFLTGPELKRAVAAEGLPAKGTPRRSSVLLSGCADDEYSYDAWLSDRYNGAFTYYALRARNFYTPDTANLKTWHNNIRRFLPADRYPQTPLLQGSWYQRTFWRL